MSTTARRLCACVCAPRGYRGRGLDWVRRMLDPQRRRHVYLTMLSGGFALFSSARIVAYLPTVWAIHSSGDASQHSLWTWATWLGSNLTMAAWLYEQDGRRLGRAAGVSLCNAAMCAAITTLIVVHRW